LGGRARWHLPCLQVLLEPNHRALGHSTARQTYVAVELLAAIGKVESGHARGGRADEDGTTVGPILNGSGFAAIADTDDGPLDPHNTYDATLGAARYLCSRRPRPCRPKHRDTAILRYNHSNAYRTWSCG
jgi:hypothetical protein